MDEAEKYPSQLAERFQVRLPDGMRDKLRKAAEANNRSMNAEIVARLEQSFIDSLIEDFGSEGEPARSNLLMRAISKAEEMYSNMVDKLEARTKIMEANNQEMRDELERRIKKLNIELKEGNHQK